MVRWVVGLAAVACTGALTLSCSRDPSPTPSDRRSAPARTDPGPTTHVIKTAFVIVMENANWDNQNDGQVFIHDNPAAPYINGTLLPHSSYCTNYLDNPAGVHPSEPNYIWLEAGHNLGVISDADPSARHVLSTHDHLTSYMSHAGIPWRAYVEDIDGRQCPLASSGAYAPKHVPFVFFSDIVGSPPDPASSSCIEHIRPYSELAGDLESGKVAAYNFITPNLCNDMHTPCGADPVARGDAWLARQIPMIENSRAFASGGALFLVWDESVGGEFPIGMIVSSPYAKGGGYRSRKRYYHSSMVATVERLFGLSPLLNDAANRPDLSDLFKTFP